VSTRRVPPSSRSSAAEATARSLNLMHAVMARTEKLKRLPEEHQHEVADFVDFLLSRTPDTPDAARVLRETAGMWKGEAEGIGHENALREQ
jgi:uncharacterized protein DUF2281